MFETRIRPYTTIPGPGDSLYCVSVGFCCGAFYRDPIFPVCAAGYVEDNSVEAGCIEEEPDPKALGPSCPAKGTSAAGNPVSIPSGNKFEQVVDFATPGANSLRFVRYYNSQTKYRGPFGRGWRHNFIRFLTFEGNVHGAPGWIDVHRPEGQVLRFARTGSGYDNYIPDSDVDATLTRVGGKWELQLGHDLKETYSEDRGRLELISYVNGYQQTVNRIDAGLRIGSVTDSYGRSITFEYGAFPHDSAQAILAVIDPDGKRYDYRYGNGHRLTEVIAPGNPGYPAGRPTTTYHYELGSFSHLLTGITDETGVRYASWTYDQDTQRVTSSSHALDAGKVTFAYDDVNKIVTTTNALNKETRYHYATIAGTSKITQVEGVASANCLADDSTYSYDAKGYVSSMTDREGNVTNTTNNSWGLPETIVEAVGASETRTTSMTWHGSFRLPTQVVQPNLTTDFTYDAAGNLLTRTETDTTSHTVPYSTQGQTRQWSFTYGPTGLLASIDGARPGPADTTSFTYNADGHLIKITNALGHELQITSLTKLGLPLIAEDENGVETHYRYNERDWVIEIAVGSGVNKAITRFDYNDNGLVRSVTAADGSVLNYGYDDAQRLTEISTEEGERILRTLDKLGNITRVEVQSESGAILQSFTQSFDELGRQLKHIGAANQETVFAYDRNDNLTSFTDPKGYSTQYAFDGLNRLISETDNLTQQVGYGLDGADNLTSVTDKRSNATTYVYNGFGDVIRRVSPDSGVTDYVYDPAGNLIQMTDARSVVTSFTYDDLNRVTARSYPGQPSENVTYSYDDVTGGNKGIGQLTGVTDESGATGFRYDERGNVIEETRTIGGQVYVTGYAYDGANNLSRITYPSGRIIEYLRDDLGRIEHVRTRLNAAARGGMLASNVRYKAFGPVASWRHGNGLTTSLSYDQDYRLTQAVTTDGVFPVRDVSVAYDPAGNVSSITDGTDAAFNEVFGYDTLHRLTSAEGYYGTLAYSYDANDNRLSRTESNGGTVIADSFSYGAADNRLLTAVRTESGGTTSYGYSYTANGNISAQTPALEGRSYGYNHANRLASVLLEQSGGGDLWSTRTYNAFGERVIKRTHIDGQAPALDEVVHYHYGPGGLLLAESDGAGVITREYVYLNDLPLAVLDPAADVTGSDIIVDNGDPGTSSLGSWASESGGSGYEGVDFTAVTGGSGTDSYSWQPALPSNGDYQVYVKWPAGIAGRASKVTYEVAHAEGVTPIEVDQREGGGEWHLLGTYGLQDGVGHGVTLSGEVEAVGPAETIVDNDHPGVSYSGTWVKKTTLSFWGRDFMRQDASAATDRFIWPAAVPAAGRYRVYTQAPTFSTFADTAVFTVVHRDGSTATTVNQQDRNNQWHYIGSYYLDPSQGHQVELSNANTGQLAVADAIRFVRDTSTALAEEIWIDDDDPTQTSKVGSWISRSSTTVPDEYWGSTFTRQDPAAPGDVFTYTPNLTAASYYRVYVNWVHWRTYSDSVTYRIHHAGGSTDVVRSHQVNGGDWNALGTYLMEPGQNHRVEVRNSGGSFAIVDAARFVPQPGPDATDIVIDNTDPEASSAGAWGSSVYTAGGMFWGTDFVRQDSPAPGDVFVWTPTLLKAGSYRLYTRWAEYSGRTEQAAYTVHHAGGSTEVVYNQKPNGGRWMPLGRFTLEPGQNHRIELRNNGSEGTAAVDAVRLVYEGESLIAAADSVRFVPNALSGVAYLHGDHLGTPKKMTGDAGTVIWDAAYTPFGGEASVVGAEDLDLRFPGQIQDLESGRALASLVQPLHYNYYRDYDPASGRYLQVDPIGLAGGLNPYGYANQNPGIVYDPNGLSPVCLTSPAAMAACAAAGVVSGALLSIAEQLWFNDGNWLCIEWSEVGIAAAIAGATAFALPAATRYLAGSALGASAMAAAANAGKAAASKAGSAAKAIANAAKSVGKKSVPKSGGRKGTSVEVTTPSGNTFTGNSTRSSRTGGDPRAPMNDQVSNALDNVKNPSGTHGACCEIDAMNKVANAGDSLKGARMGPVRDNKTGAIKPPCSTCRDVMNQLGVEY